MYREADIYILRNLIGLSLYTRLYTDYSSILTKAREIAKTNNSYIYISLDQKESIYMNPTGQILTLPEMKVIRLLAKD